MEGLQTLVTAAFIPAIAALWMLHQTAHKKAIEQKEMLEALLIRILASTDTLPKELRDLVFEILKK